MTFYNAIDVTKTVNAASSAAGWDNLTQQYGLVALGRYSWLEYAWGGGAKLPGTSLSGELAPDIMVSVVRQDTMTGNRTLQGPVGWVEHEPGMYHLVVGIRQKVEAVANPQRPRIQLVTADERPFLMWTSVLNAVATPPALIPGQARYVYAHSANGLGTGVLVDWRQGQTSVFGVSTRLQINLRCRVPANATHFEHITLSTALSFE